MKKYMPTFTRRQLYLCTVLCAFFLGVGVISYTFFLHTPDVARSMFTELTSSYETSESADRGTHGLFFGIFMGNGKIVLAMLLFGFLPFVVLPFFGAAMTAMAIGLVLAVFEMEAGIGGELLLYGLLPHVVFEMLAFILAGWWGSCCSWNVAKSIWRRSASWVAVRDRLVREFVHIAIILAPLLLIGAFLETTLSPWLFDHYVRK